MTDTSKSELAARAKAAVARALAEQGIAPAPPADPDLMVRLERAMLALPHTTREVFLAHRIDGFSYGDIADRTGLSVHQVRRHMAKAILQLARYAAGDERTGWQRWRETYLLRWLR